MKIQEAILGWAYSTFCMISYTAAFSHGASLVACVDMKPRHIRAQLQNPRNSYVTIYTNVSSYSPGDKVPVTVRSRGDFMGFLLQARRVSDDQIAGTFVSIPSGSKLMSCFEGANTVTHLDKSPKRNLSFVWKAPQQPTGDIKFFLSVVQSYFIYWERIESTIVSQQTQNRTLSDGNMEPAASLWKPNGLEVTTTVPSITLAQHTQPVAFAVVSLAGTSVTDSLESALVTTETPGDEEHLLNPSPLGDMAAGARGSDQGGQPDQDGPHPDRDQTSEPSLAVPVLENFPFQDDGSSRNPPNRTRGDSEPPCPRCEEGEQVRAPRRPGGRTNGPMKYACPGLAVPYRGRREHGAQCSRSRLSQAAGRRNGPLARARHPESAKSFQAARNPPRLWGRLLEAPAWACSRPPEPRRGPLHSHSAQTHGEPGGPAENGAGSLRGALTLPLSSLPLLLKERPEASGPPQTGPPGAPPTARLSSSRPGGAPPDSRGGAEAPAAWERPAPRLSGLPEAQGGAGERGARRAEAGREPGGPGLRSARRGVLLCLSATLGLALAAGLRRLRARPCRRRGTRGSLPEPDVPAERDGERHCACRGSGSAASGLVRPSTTGPPPAGARRAAA
ncbi:reelin domain-containing protein 1 [Sarcophilus harrisii]|uniref:reelin domain-containing protein 1 n=1 Tax=Sarcophilus harrisii TaxID=9305 RepID=UPI001301F1D2|nr:reelin domain-containing protein 1 [Sarcophilus harrisii]